MRSKKKPTKTEEVAVRAGKVKIPLQFVVSVIAALGLGGVGTAAGQHMQSDEKLVQAQIDIVEMKTDIKWIKNKLSEGDRPALDSRSELSKSASPDQYTCHGAAPEAPEPSSAQDESVPE